MSDSVSVVPFNSDNFIALLTGPPCLISDVASNPRARYLIDYLAALKAATIVCEFEYVDADYLDDYASFYAKSFENIPKRCRRLHFFNKPLDDESFRLWVLNAEYGEKAQQSYLGFVVARPLPTAIIGRTVLVTYPDDAGRRHYTALRTYDVNLFGVQLQVESLAFQEQDTSLAACATVALWTCFQKTQELFRSRAPTPVAITRDANRLLLAARPFPSRGLQIEQICNAITAVGLDPEVYAVTADLPLVSLVCSYLRLGLPVLAVVEIAGIGLHAIALNGYSMRDTQQIGSEGANVNSLLPKLMGLRVDEFYGHDDQHGPFSRIKLIEPNATHPTIVFRAYGAWASELTPRVIVVPVHPKIRTGFREVLRWLPTLSMVASWVIDPSGFEWSVYLTSSNDFKRDLRSGAIAAPIELREKLLLTGLPKYLWHCTLTSAGAAELEILLDTTAMVNGFPILQLWWNKQNLKDLIRSVAMNPTLAVQLTSRLGTRLVTKLRTD